ncbi:hypothetical protein DCAR_0100093 [Daucus carota subsp. sativus]|uniref:Uncharacterized protein n=1 Tax=Daucus carota subsp. sativus TaxID=79200 RepID=A0AAF0W179_DAUCS|nr:hypothetical protein DCAR_0100064 [Daucus carota subsp. sativus]WOG80948.1 hypothetical protein DCAR_0100093 [Daucus carota subsp. sativus]
MGAGHARSRYLNRKEGDAEGRASDWSEVLIIPGRNKLIGSPFLRPHVPPCGDMRAKKGKRGMGGRLARRAISSVVERAPDNCVVVPGL